MKLILFILMITTILFTGCFKEDGQVRIYSDIENATIYIDGNKKGTTGTSIALADGKHEVRIYKEINEEWYHEGKQSIYVGENTPDNFKIYTDKKPTELRLERLAREAILAKEDLVLEGKKANAAAAVTLEEARAGNLDSMKLIAGYYENGYGVKIDIQKAEFWKKKVNLLSKEKQEEEERLVKEMQAKAAATLKKARAGNVDSMKLMIEYYESGYGVKINAYKAEYWKKKVNQLAKEKIDEEQRLAKEKIDEEQRLAKEKIDEEQRLAKEKREKSIKLFNFYFSVSKDEQAKRFKARREARIKAKRLKIAKEYGFSSYPVDTYIDTETKLMWQDNEDTKNVYKDWSGAKEYCQDLSIGEYSDWKLPSYLELLSIFTYQKDNYTIKNSFKNVTLMNYWSSSENVNSRTFAWHVNFGKGDAVISSKSNRYNVRCVRGAVSSLVFEITD
ncbi:MAG: DUF1566 domain-containing protein [Sulfurimonas sp.]|nr:DUF1566 domain-containing protein [Sulfurimonas sp.]